MIEPSLAYLLDHFRHTEFIFLADEFTPHSSPQVPMRLGPDRKSLKESRLGYVRLVGIGIDSSQPAEFHALLIFNARRGSGGCLPGFAGKIIDSARNLGVGFALHRLAKGPVKMIDTNTCATVEVFSSLTDAVNHYFSRIRGSLFHVENLDLALHRAKSSRWMLGMAAEAAGEMMSPVDFSPVRFSEDLERRLGLLRSQRAEFGFVDARLMADKPMIGALKGDAESLGMVGHEVQLDPAAGRDGFELGPPILLVTMQDRRMELMDRLNELAVQHRQDHVLRVFRDGGIELVAPYHNAVVECFTDLHAAARAYVGSLNRNSRFFILALR